MRYLGHDILHILDIERSFTCNQRPISLTMWEIQLSVVSQCLLLVLATVIFTLWLKWKNNLTRIMVNKIPGPTGALPIVGNIWELALLLLDTERRLLRLVESYNGIFRLWKLSCPNVVITSPEHFKAMYTSPNTIDRGTQYQYGEEYMGKSVFIAGGTQWKSLRKILMTNFSNTPTSFWIANFQNESKTLLAEFRKKADGPDFPCGELLLNMTASTILRNALGEEIPKETVKTLVHFGKFVLIIPYIRSFSFLLYFDAIFNMTPISRYYKQGAKLFRAFSLEIIKKKKKQLADIKKKMEPMPNIYIFNLLENNGEEYSDEILANELTTLIMTGLDTTGGTMAFVLIILGLFPEVQEKVYQEDVDIQRRLEGRDLGVKDLQNYLYLDRVIKETLRLFPVVPKLSRKLSEDTYFGTHLVPKNVNIVAMPVFTNRSSKYFAEPLQFQPDRFLPENLEKMAPYSFAPFSAGPRICPGMRYAYIGMKITLLNIVRDFRIFSKYKTLDEVFSNEKHSFTLKDKNDFPIRLESRSSSTSSQIIG